MRSEELDDTHLRISTDKINVYLLINVSKVSKFLIFNYFGK